MFTRERRVSYGTTVYFQCITACYATAGEVLGPTNEMWCHEDCKARDSWLDLIQQAKETEGGMMSPVWCSSQPTYCLFAKDRNDDFVHVGQVESNNPLAIGELIGTELLLLRYPNPQYRILDTSSVVVVKKHLPSAGAIQSIRRWFDCLQVTSSITADPYCACNLNGNLSNRPEFLSGQLWRKIQEQLLRRMGSGVTVF